MNIEEAKKIVDKLSVDSDELWKIPMIPAHKVKALLDTLDQSKPEIPQFVADWIEDQKQSFDDSSAIDMYENLTLDNHGGYYHDVWLWAIDHHNDFVFAWTYGYTIEKEKLYTVEIPDPNNDYWVFTKLEKRKSGKVKISHSDDLNWKQKTHNQLTESEIRKDFDWAWQWAEEVTE